MQRETLKQKGNIFTIFFLANFAVYGFFHMTIHRKDVPITFAMEGDVYYNAATNKTLVVPIHGNKDLPKGTFFAILKQAGIDKNELT